MRRVTSEHHDLPPDDVTPDDVTREALKWAYANKGLKVAENAHYGSPRISSEIMDCSMPLTFDSYSYCSYGCNYCFAYFFKAANPSMKDMTLRSVNFDRVIGMFKGTSDSVKHKLYWEMFFKRRFLFHWGGMADPFCNFERQNGVGYKLMQYLDDTRYPTLFSFKGDVITEPKYRTLFEKAAPRHNFAFQISMVTADDNMGRKIEIGVPLPSKRLKMMKMLSDMGYWTILRLRPFVIGVTDESLDELLERAYAAGMRAISTEFYAMDIRASGDAKKRFQWLSKLMGIADIEKYFADLSPSERGGYRRLNRLVKERFVKKMYKFCLDHDVIFACSDPDFKELNMSGSCCGMPDVYPDNTELCDNWTRHQLTYVLKELRRHYHITGECSVIRFHDVFRDEEYLSTKHYSIATDHISAIGWSSADLRQITYEKILLGQWNNLHSPACPVNYLDGKLVPCGLDDEGYIMYKYNPMPYEVRWSGEGIDLGRR